MLALGVPSGLHELVGLDAVDPAQGGEEQDPVVGVRHEEVLHDVVPAQLGTLDAAAAAVLGAVLVRAGALDVAVAGDGDHHLLLRDEVLHGHVPVEAVEDLGAAVVTVALHDLRELLRDDLALASLGRDDLLVLGDQPLQLRVPVLDLLTLQGGQAAQLHVEDRLGLGLVDAQQLHEPVAGLLHGGGAADQGDDLVQRVQGLEQAQQDVRLLLRLLQAVPGAPHDDVHLVAHPVVHERVQGQRARHTVHEREHVRGEVLLQLRVLVEVVEHHLGHGVPLEHDHQALAGAPRGLVAHVRDALDLPVLDEVRDLDGQVVRIDLVRQLGDHQARAVVDLLHTDHRALRDGAAARAVGLLDPLVAQDLRARGEVRALDPLDELLQQGLAVHVRVLQVPLDAVRHLAQVVRRDVRGHAHRDARGAVDQQVREPGRQHRGLLLLAVVVVLEVHGVLVDVPDHLHGQRRHLGLGVPGRGGAVVARGAEVALAQRERVAHGPVLDQTHQGVVDRGVAVGVVVAHHVADHARALVERALRAVAAVVHGVEHAAVHGLETVPHVRQRTAHDHGHRVVQVGALHLRLQVDLLHAVGGHLDVLDHHALHDLGGVLRVHGAVAVLGLVTHALLSVPCELSRSTVHAGRGISGG